ncbi:MAG: amidohydrolase family protein [Bryobacteraceae bacterium]|jgi:predicted TIM-barrel fold metal-dependent hydrolase
MNRREWMTLSATTLAARRAIQAQQPSSSSRVAQTASAGFPLEQYEPKSMLHVAETHVQRSRFPVIDFHTHITGVTRNDPNRVQFSMDPSNCLVVMDRKNIRTMVSLTGGYGDGLRDALAKLPEAHPGRFIVFTEPAWTRASEPGYAKLQAGLIEDAHRAGAVGLKILKTLGLYLRDQRTNGLVRIDDPRFDPMWDAAGALKMPVAIHTSDPEAFFLPINRFNERWEELHVHPSWSFHGKNFPSNRELQEARRNVMRRHPRTQFVCLHVANSEDLPYVSECMDSHQNMSVDIAARIGELGRQPRMSRKFFDKYQDRIVFGTDASAGPSTPQQSFGDALYEVYYRFLETEDEYFDYAPARIPPQGRWRIYGIGLSEQVLRKVYWDNAARLLGLPVREPGGS